MSSPDIPLGAGDTAPITSFTLRQPDDSEGNQGDPLDLTGTTVVFRLQPKNRSIAPANRAVTIVGDPTLGQTEVDWLATGGPLPPGDYICRYIVIYPDTHQISVPNGDRNASSGLDANGDDDDDTFFWLKVAPDFTAVP